VVRQAKRYGSTVKCYGNIKDPTTEETRKCVHVCASYVRATQQNAVAGLEWIVADSLGHLLLCIEPVDVKM